MKLPCICIRWLCALLGQPIGRCEAAGRRIGLRNARRTLHYQCLYGCSRLCNGCCCRDLRRRKAGRLIWLQHRVITRLGLGDSSHHGLEFASLLVKHKKFLGQGWLVTQHVEHEAQSPEVSGQHFKGAADRARFRWRSDDLLDVVAHARECSPRLVQPKHGQHTLHLTQLLRHITQHAAVIGLAEEFVQRTLQRGQ